MKHSGLGVLFVLSALALAARPASAQSPSRSARINAAFANALLAETSTEELTAQLHLDEAQSQQVAAILLDFTVRYYELADEWRDRDRENTRQAMEVDEARNNAAPGDLSWMSKAHEQTQAFAEFQQWKLSTRQRLNTLNTDATSRIEGVLNRDQQDSLQALLRIKRRQRTLAANAYFAAECVDLVHLFLELDLLSPEEKQRVRPTLDRYAEDLDPVLRDRNELLAREEAIKLTPREPTELDRAMKEGRISPEEFVPRYRAQVAWEREQEIERKRPLMIAHQRLADMTTANYQTCLGLVDSATAAIVSFQFLRTAYAMEAVNSPLAADQFIDDALGLDSLSDMQKSQIATIRDEFWLPRRREVELNLIQATDRRQRGWESRVRVDATWNQLTQAVTDAYDHRTALEEQVVQQVVDVLTSDQRNEVKIPIYE